MDISVSNKSEQWDAQKLSWWGYFCLFFLEYWQCLFLFVFFDWSIITLTLVLTSICSSTHIYVLLWMLTMFLPLLFLWLFYDYIDPSTYISLLLSTCSCSSLNADIASSSVISLAVLWLHWPKYLHLSNPFHLLIIFLECPQCFFLYFFTYSMITLTLILTSLYA